MRGWAREGEHLGEGSVHYGGTPVIFPPSLVGYFTPALRTIRSTEACQSDQESPQVHVGSATMAVSRPQVEDMSRGKA